jgi:hypothetical protein
MFSWIRSTQAQAFGRELPSFMVAQPKLANTFLWQPAEAGWPPNYADEMTGWLTLRL